MSDALVGFVVGCGVVAFLWYMWKIRRFCGNCGLELMGNPHEFFCSRCGSKILKIEKKK